MPTKPKASALTPQLRKELKARNLRRNVSPRYMGDVRRSSEDWLRLFKDPAQFDAAAERLKQVAMEADPSKPGYEGNEVVAQVARALTQLQADKREALVAAAGNPPLFRELPDGYDPLGNPRDLQPTDLEQQFEDLLTQQVATKDVEAAKSPEQIAADEAAEIEAMRYQPSTLADSKYAEEQYIDPRAPISRPLPEKVANLPPGHPDRVRAEQQAVQRIVGTNQFKEVQGALKDKKIPVLPRVATRSKADAKRLADPRGVLAGATSQQARALKKRIQSIRSRPTEVETPVADEVSVPDVREGDVVIEAAGPPPPPGAVSGRGWREVVNVEPAQNLRPARPNVAGDPSQARAAIDLAASRLDHARRSIATDFSLKIMSARGKQAKEALDAQAKAIDAEYASQLADPEFLQRFARQMVEQEDAELLAGLQKSAADAEAAGDATAASQAQHRIKVATQRAAERAASFDALASASPEEGAASAPLAAGVTRTFEVLPHVKAAMDAGPAPAPPAQSPRAISRDVKKSRIAALKEQISEINRRRAAFEANPSGPAAAWTPRIATIRKGTGGIDAPYKSGDRGFARTTDQHLEQTARSERERLMEAIYRAAAFHNADSVAQPDVGAPDLIPSGVDVGLDPAIRGRSADTPYRRSSGSGSASSFINTIDLSKYAPWVFSHIARRTPTGEFEWPTNAPSAEFVVDQMIGRHGIKDPEEFRSVATPVIEASLQEQAALGPQSNAAIIAASTRLNPNMHPNANAGKFYPSPFGMAYQQERMFHPTLEMRRLEPSIEAGSPGSSAPETPFSMEELEAVLNQPVQQTDWDAVFGGTDTPPSADGLEWESLLNQPVDEMPVPPSAPDTPANDPDNLDWLNDLGYSGGPRFGPLSMNKAPRSALAGLIA